MFCGWTSSAALHGRLRHVRGFHDHAGAFLKDGGLVGGSGRVDRREDGPVRRVGEGGVYGGRCRLSDGGYLEVGFVGGDERGHAGQRHRRFLVFLAEE